MSIKIILLFIFSSLLSFSKFVSCSVYKLSDLSQISKEYLVGKITFDNVIESIFDFIQYNSSFDLFVNYGISNLSCAEALVKAKKEQDSISNVMIYSGLSVLDVGKEEECKGSNMTYFFLTYDMKYDPNSFLAKYFTFVEEKNFYKGICLFRECTSFFKMMFNMEKNKKLKETLHKLGINNLEVFSFDYTGHENQKKLAYQEKYKMKSLIVLFILFGLYVFIRVFFSILYSCFYKKIPPTTGVTQLYPLNINDSGSDNAIFNKNKKRSTKNRFCYKFCSFCSLHKNYRILLKKTSKFYNENGIKQLSGLKVITLFLITMSHNSWVILKLPHKDLSVISALNSMWFGAVKFCILGFESLKIINGVNFGYKYINYIKKNVKNFTFIKALQFYAKGIPVIVSFIIATICLHYFTMEFGLTINPSAEYEHFIQKTVTNRHCMINPLYIFFPMYYQYIYQNDDCVMSSYTSCFQNIHFALSEFYCFTFVVFLTFFLCKIKSNILDIIVYIINFLLIFTTIFVFDDSKNPYTDYTISRIYGSSLSFIKPHLFLILYFMGFNIGVMYYHYKDLSSDNTNVTNDYIPYRFNTYISKIYSKIPSFLQIIIWIITIILMILVAFNYSIVSYSLDKNSQLIQENYWIRFTYKYEGFIYGILFGLFLIFILMGEVNINYFLSNNLFVSFGRVYYAYFLLDNFYLSIFHAMYRIDIYLNIKNVIFMSIPIAFFNLFSSICFVILFELPIKRVINQTFSSGMNTIKQSFIEKEE